MGGIVVAGTDSVDGLVSKLVSLRDKCTFAPAGRCELVGYGVSNGYNYNHRVTAGGIPVYGSDQPIPAIQKMKQLQEQGICR